MTDMEERIVILWIKTWGRNPTFPERDETQKLIDKFGYEKTYDIMYEANLEGFKKIKTLVNALDEKGNILSKEEKKWREQQTVINKKKEAKKDSEHVEKIISLDELKKVFEMPKREFNKKPRKILTKTEFLKIFGVGQLDEYEKYKQKFKSG